MIYYTRYLTSFPNPWFLQNWFVNWAKFIADYTNAIFPYEVTHSWLGNQQLPVLSHKKQVISEQNNVLKMLACDFRSVPILNCIGLEQLQKLISAAQSRNLMQILKLKN